MEYREFVCAAIETMNQRRGKRDTGKRTQSSKNNGKIRVGLLLQETGSNLFPTIYLEEYYEKFQKGKLWNRLCRRSASFIKRSRQKYHRCGFFFNLESWKNKLGIKVIKRRKQGITGGNPAFGCAGSFADLLCHFRPTM